MNHWLAYYRTRARANAALARRHRYITGNTDLAWHYAYKAMGQLALMEMHISPEEPFVATPPTIKILESGL